MVQIYIAQHAATIISPCDIERYVSYVRDIVESEKKKLILVGHSLGWVIITKVIDDIIDDVIEKVYYISALIPTNGDTVASMLKKDNGSELSTAVRMSKKDLTIELIFEKARTIYYNGCSDEDFEFARGLILPQSIIPFSTPLELQNNKRTNSVGIVSENDKFLSPDYQRLMHKKAGCKIRSIASGHAPFFSIFSQLAEMLSEN